MPKKDYYQILGVSKDATQDQIKSAYRKLAKTYHPDLHPDDKEAAEKFKECNEAYSVIGDPEKRRKYDNGEMDFDGFGGQGGFNPFGGGNGGFSATGFDDIFDMFSGMFGGGTRRSARTSANQQGSDITYTLQLTFMEAALGCQKRISFSRTEKCPVCQGSGAKDANSVKTCDKCGGSGRVRYRQNTIFGEQITVGACDKCGGTGKIITYNCKSCGGKGVTTKNKVMNVTIPAGVENGTVLQLAGQGNSAKGSGANGNLLLVLQVMPSKMFKRNNLDLYVDVPVAFSTAVCGGEVEIPALDGVFIHKLPEGTGNGDVVRFRGKGIKTGRGNVGDLYVTVKVEIPRGVTKAQKDLLQNFERECTLRNYPKRKDFLDEISKLYKK